jgi:hypothetical protein
MRRIWLYLTAALLVIVVAVPAFAWEFKLKGDSEWRYRYWSRLGDNDLFGTMDSNAVNLGINHLQVFPTSGTTNRVGSGFGVLAGTNRYGSEMMLNDTRTTIYPTIKVNRAISIDAAVNLTSLGIWSDGAPYVDPQAPRAAAVGYVNSLYVPIQDRAVAAHVPNTYVTVEWVKWSIKTPMLDFSLGYKTSGFGIGLWKHKCNRSSASFSVSAHYGPFKIGFSPYFGRKESAWNNFPDGAPNTYWNRIAGNNSPARHVEKRNYFAAFMGELEYSCGPFQFALLSDSYHEPSAPDTRSAGRGSALAGDNSTRRPSEDILRYRIGMAAKYFNGRYFLNAEGDYFNRWRAGRGTADPGNGTPTDANMRVREGRDNTAWLYALELGGLAGPAKITLNYARATGDDPSTRHTSEDAAVGESGITSCYMKEWGYLMYYMYGTGDGWDAAGWGQPTNFHHLGGKVDYAVASNLNMRLIYSQAWRDQPNAYRMGGDYRIGAQTWSNEDIRLSQLGTFRGQAVPDSARDIGWECDLGFDWKLLENFTWSATFAYWKPGNWWGYALPNTANIYRTLNGGAATGNPNNTPAGEALATFNLGRDIDPLFAAETTLLIKF